MKRICLLCSFILLFLLTGCGASGKTTSSNSVPYKEWDKELAELVFNGKGIFTELPDSNNVWDNLYTSNVTINDKKVSIVSLCCPKAQVGSDTYSDYLYLIGFTNYYEWSVDDSKDSKNYLKFKADGYNYSEECNLSFDFKNPKFYSKSGLNLGVQITVSVSSGSTKLSPSVTKTIFKSK